MFFVKGLKKWSYVLYNIWGQAVAQLVGARRYKR